MRESYRIVAVAMSLTISCAASSAAPGNTTRGERLYRACVACHSLEPNRNMTGPSLAELWGRKAGGLPSFPRYSPALKGSGIIWNDDTLDEWLKDPQHFISGNTMTFVAVAVDRGRASLGRLGYDIQLCLLLGRSQSGLEIEGRLQYVGRVAGWDRRQRQ